MRMVNYGWHLSGEVLDILATAPRVVGMQMFSQSVIYPLKSFLCEITGFLLIVKPCVIWLPNRRHQRDRVKVYVDLGEIRKNLRGVIVPREVRPLSRLRTQSAVLLLVCCISSKCDRA